MRANRFLSSVAAIGASFGIALAANVPLTTGVQDPSQILSIINTLTQNINQNASGILAVQTSIIVSAATTIEQTLFQATVQANQLTNSGQRLRARCSGVTGSSTNVKGAKLYIGTNAVSTNSMTSPGQNWDLTLEVTYGASATSTNMVGTAMVASPNAVTGVTDNQGGVNVVATTNAVDDLRTNLLAKCTATNGVAELGTTGIVFSVEQVK